MIQTESTVAAIARRHPATVKVFQRHQIDFCCGGKRPLGEVCRERDLEPTTLVAELEEACRRPGEDRDWTAAPLAELTGHIVRRYHDALRVELPLIGELAVKVATRHGERHPELVEVEAIFDRLRREMFQHMLKEEHVLFPLIENLEGAARGELAAAPFPVVLDGPVAAMEDDHDEVARFLARLRGLTAGFVPPEGACNSFRGLFQALADLEADTHVHIHLENNILFPRAQELAARAGAA